MIARVKFMEFSRSGDERGELLKDIFNLNLQEYYIYI